MVDSKVVLTAMYDYYSTDDETLKADALVRHIAAMKEQVRKLSKKDYSRYLRPGHRMLDYVIMFVPNESAMQLALYEDGSLWREAFENGVFITSEQNLLALLRMIQLAWTQVKQARNQQEIFESVQKLLGRVAEFMKRYDDMGKKIESLQTSYDDTRKKLYSGNQSVVKAANQIARISGIQEMKELEIDN